MSCRERSSNQGKFLVGEMIFLVCLIFNVGLCVNSAFELDGILLCDKWIADGRGDLWMGIVVEILVAIES